MKMILKNKFILTMLSILLIALSIVGLCVPKNTYKLVSAAYVQTVPTDLRNLKVGDDISGKKMYIPYTYNSCPHVKFQINSNEEPFTVEDEVRYYGITFNFNCIEYFSSSGLKTVNGFIDEEFINEGDYLTCSFPSNFGSIRSFSDMENAYYSQIFVSKSEMGDIEEPTEEPTEEPSEDNGNKSIVDWVKDFGKSLISTDFNKNQIITVAVILVLGIVIFGRKK